HNLLPTDLDALIRLGRPRLPRMHALHGRILVKQSFRHHCTSRASLLMDTLSSLSFTLAPFPVVISIPSLLSTIFSFGSLFISIVMPPSLAESFRVIVPTSVLSTFFSGMSSFLEAFAGDSPFAQKHPHQIG